MTAAAAAAAPAAASTILFRTTEQIRALVQKIAKHPQISSPDFPTGTQNHSGHFLNDFKKIFAVNDCQTCLCINSFNLALYF